MSDVPMMYKPFMRHLPYGCFTKTARKVSLSHAFLGAPHASKNKDPRAVSLNASRQSTGRMTNRPRFAQIQGHT